MAVEKLRGAVADLAGRLELPADLIAGVPRVQITGYRALTVEQHHGIEQYQPDEVCIRVAGGRVRVAGEELTIQRMDRTIVALAGTVRSVALETLP